MIRHFFRDIGSFFVLLRYQKIKKVISCVKILIKNISTCYSLHFALDQTIKVSQIVCYQRWGIEIQLPGQSFVVSTIKKFNLWWYIHLIKSIFNSIKVILFLNFFKGYVFLVFFSNELIVPSTPSTSKRP